MKVSACIITYNQAAYIAQCIEGALMQQVDESYEIVIGDDCSSDETSRICREYQEKHSDIIRWFRREPNLGMQKNVVQTINDCRGDYIAYCEGDDYWTDAHKLQKQVALLEAHPELSAVCHGVSTLHPDGRLEPRAHPQKPSIDFDDLVVRNSIATVSVMARSDARSRLAEAAYMPFPDYFMHLVNSTRGNIGFIAENMAVYRSGIGVYGSQNKAHQMRSEIKLFMEAASSEQFSAEQKTALLDKTERLIAAYVQRFTEDKDFDLLCTLIGTGRYPVVNQLTLKLAGTLRAQEQLLGSPSGIARKMPFSALVKAIGAKLKRGKPKIKKP